MLAILFAREAAADFTQAFQSDPHPGIHRETWKDSSIPAVVRAIRIDLTSAEIQVVATKPDDRGITTSAYAAKKAAAVAINGDSFSVTDYQPTGFAMGEAQWWVGTTDDGTSAVFDFARVPTPTVGEFTVAELVPTGLVVTQTNLPPATLGAISGRPQLVRNGFIAAPFDCTDARTIACERAPRSALALADDGNTLWLLAVDGWQGASIGLTDTELATFLVTYLHVQNAIALDGGASSTLVVDGNVISNPSDGIERAVANHLAIQYAAQPNGSIIGVVCEKKVNPCNTLAGVTMTLDDGSTQPTSATGVYNFTSLSPRYTCVSAELVGYYPTSRCVVVGPGPQPTYDSIALQPCPQGGCPPVDAGAADARLPYPDAGPLPDGGTPAHGPGGGCCDAGGGTPPICLVCLVAWCLVRRRGTVA